MDPYSAKKLYYQAQYNYQSMPFILADNKTLRNIGTIEEVETTHWSVFFDSSSSTVYIRTPNDSSPENYDIRADSVETELEQSKVLLEEQGLDLIPEPPESPLPYLKVNGKDDSVIVSFGIPVDCTFSLDSKNYSGKNADWWFYVDTHFGIRYYFNGSNWVANETSALQSPLYNFFPSNK